MSTKETDPKLNGKHLLFYDGVCGLCDHAVHFVLSQDHQQEFLFAPLQGETAKPHHFKELHEDTLVLIENFQSDSPKQHILGQAGLRILWLLGGVWSIPGLLYFITPAFLSDPVYRFVAKRRYKVFGKKECVIFPEKQRERFLD